MNKPTSIQSAAATTHLISASSRAQADLRRAAENIDFAFKELYNAKACVQGRRHHDQAYIRTLESIGYRLQQLRALVEAEAIDSVFTATSTWLSVEDGVLEDKAGVERGLIETGLIEE